MKKLSNRVPTFTLLRLAGNRCVKLQINNSNLNDNCREIYIKKKNKDNIVDSLTLIR